MCLEPEPKFGFAAPWSRSRKKYFWLRNTDFQKVFLTICVAVRIGARISWSRDRKRVEIRIWIQEARKTCKKDLCFEKINVLFGGLGEAFPRYRKSSMES
jgi:hypothetical protein